MNKRNAAAEEVLRSPEDVEVRLPEDFRMSGTRGDEADDFRREKEDWMWVGELGTAARGARGLEYSRRTIREARFWPRGDGAGRAMLVGR